MNNVSITGFLTSDPKINGTAVSFSFAENNKNGEVETTTWLNCVTFKGAADQAKDLIKGDWCYVNGFYQTSEHEGKTYPQFIIFKVESADMWKRRKAQREAGEAPQTPPQSGTPQKQGSGNTPPGPPDDFIEDDIPF